MDELFVTSSIVTSTRFPFLFRLSSILETAVSRLRICGSFFISMPKPKNERLIFADRNISSHCFTLLSFEAKSLRRSDSGLHSRTIQFSSVFRRSDTSVINTVFPDPRTPVIIYICWLILSVQKESRISFFGSGRSISSIGLFPKDRFNSILSSCLSRD